MKINLYNIGFDQSYIQEAARYGNRLYPARVTTQHRDMYKVITEFGEMAAEVSGRLSFSTAAAAEYPAVGDWVLVDRIDDKSGNGIIHHVLSRKSSFERKAAGKGHERQIVAANINIVFICMSLNNDFNLRRLERYLSISWDSMAMPVVLLTKADLCEDIEEKLAEINEVAMGVDVLVVSRLNSETFSDIYRYLGEGKTAAFIGSSGVGKSTLINLLMGEEVFATQEIRGDDKGRHTTTHRQMLLLPKGGVVIDTPGMRELQIAGADLTKSFSDIEELAEACFFGDCRHEGEPKCAVKKAIEDGRLSLQRVESYKKLRREMAFEENKGRMTASQAEKQKVIKMMGSLNGYKQVQKNNRKIKGNR